MLVILFRILIILTIIVIAYSLVKYIVKPERKLTKAQEKREFYFLDEEENVRKNFFITYKGLLFEGEKYLEATADSFDITRIHMNLDQHSLKGFRYEDFHFLEEEIRIRYPKATIEWSKPVKEFMKSSSTSAQPTT
ncbi:sigma-w pathway protein ysdB [Shouchella lehensis]|uniref:Sigma-w pathway protein ysdB n=1 Tax=Shouchella lehensis TaxID=300825 RepID=A0A4Y7WRN9_9BACI|nr:sigma-w pathway protein ysdB [Shouchella lehensis]MBG9783952.1 sigma-w pathway protein ysdB [Shouchella lehensis]TES51081.1 sigma-w pathway protein ysdB [Shouchella lehensis]